VESMSTIKVPRRMYSLAIALHVITTRCCMPCCTWAGRGGRDMDSRRQGQPAEQTEIAPAHAGCLLPSAARRLPHQLHCTHPPAQCSRH
jgi:hypothetical protein